MGNKLQLENNILHLKAKSHYDLQYKEQTNCHHIPKDDDDEHGGGVTATRPNLITFLIFSGLAVVSECYYCIYKNIKIPSTQLCCLLNIKDNSCFDLKRHHQVVVSKQLKIKL
jgi:hypothetical protein